MIVANTNSINNGYGIHCTEKGVKSYVAMNDIKIVTWRKGRGVPAYGKRKNKYLIGRKANIRITLSCRFESCRDD